MFTNNMEARANRVAQIIVLLSGIITLLTGVALLFAPEWFFQNIGNFPPYNRHYEGDLGTFELALGFGLLFAARNPSRHRALIAVAAAGNLLHAFNHAYDSLNEQATLAHWLTDTLPLFVFAGLLILAYYILAGRWTINDER